MSFLVSTVDSVGYSSTRLVVDAKPDSGIIDCTPLETDLALLFPDTLAYFESITMGPGEVVGECNVIQGLGVTGV